MTQILNQSKNIIIRSFFKQQQCFSWLKIEAGQKGIFCNLEQFAVEASSSDPGRGETEGSYLEGKANWQAKMLDDSGSHFQVWQEAQLLAEVKWPLMGRFNVENGLAAISASHHAGVPVKVAAKALESFKPVKRRLEVKLDNYGIKIYLRIIFKLEGL